jgi:hypothetical protein
MALSFVFLEIWVIRFGCYVLELEMVHDLIPNDSMTSHDFNDLFCSMRYLSIKQSGYN